MRVRPIENNPEVLNDLAHRLGLEQGLGFHDVYSLDDPDLLAFVPRPALALIMILPTGGGYERRRREADAGRGESDGLSERDIVWYKQTIGNACGTMAILHTVSNLEAHLEEQSDFHALLQRMKTMPTTERVSEIEGSQLILGAHDAVAGQGQSDTIEAEADVELHFVAFVKSQSSGHLFELDGSRKGPVDHGPLDGDLLSDGAMQVVKRFVAQASQGEDDLNFSLCALAPA